MESSNAKFIETQWMQHFESKGGAYRLFAQVLVYACGHKSLLVPLDYLKAETKDKEYLNNSLGELVKKSYLALTKVDKVAYVKIIHPSIRPYLEMNDAKELVTTVPEKKAPVKDDKKLRQLIEDKNHLEEMLDKEKIRYQQLIAKAKDLDLIRLEREDRKDLLEDAVAAGVAAKTQGKYIEDLELIYHELLETIKRVGPERSVHLSSASR